MLQKGTKFSQPENRNCGSPVKLSFQVPPPSFIQQFLPSQTTAVILLGVIGALFDLEAQRDPEGEVALDNHLERVTAKALMFLVLSPSTAKLASNSALRRAAIDLGGYQDDIQ